MLNLEKFIKECEENPVSLALQKSVNLGNGAYKVLCEVSRPDFKPQALKKAVGNLFKNKVSLVEASVITKAPQLLSMIVKANVRSIAFDEKNIPVNKKKVTATVYADLDDNSIWEVAKVGNKTRLVLKADENFDEIFKNSTRICTASMLDKPIEVMSGDYVSYYNSKEGKIKAGYALVSNDDEIEVTDKNMETEEVDPEAIIQSADLTSLDKNPVQAALQGEGLNKVMDYMGKMFKDTEFYNALDNMMGADQDLSEDKYPNSTMASADLESIKSEIKDFLINDSIKELREELLNAKEDEVEADIDEAPANAEGDIDFANEEEIEKNYSEEPAAEESLEDKVEEPEESFEEVEADELFQPKTVEDIDYEDQDADDDAQELLDPEDVAVTSEADLDDGDFEDVVVEEPSEEEVSNKLQELLNQ